MEGGTHLRPLPKGGESLEILSLEFELESEVLV